MRRNISVDELIKFLNPESNYVFYDDAHGFCINTQDVLDHLRAMPPADVQPVVHGEWIPVTAIYKFKEDQFPQTERVWVDATEPDEIDAVKCSICGEVFDFADARNWCTQCGAKMGKRKKVDCTDCIKEWWKLGL